MMGLLMMQASAQIQLKGKVLEAAGENPLPGAVVRLNEGLQATTTDQHGNFLFNISKKGKYTLTVSFLGYREYRQELDVQQHLSLTVRMEILSYLTDEVVINGTRVPPNAPATISRLNKEDIMARNHGRDLPYVMAGIPSAVVTSDAGTGIGYTGIRIRGTDMTRINVTINGIPYNDPESHEVYWVDLPDIASSVDNIEIQRGVGTSSNGAAAFGASINIQTQKAQTEPYAELRQSAGSYATFRSSLNAGTGLINQKFAFDTRLSLIQSDGYIDRATTDLRSFFTSASWFGKKQLIKVNVFSGKEITTQAWDGVPSYILDTNRTFNVNGMYKDAEGRIRFYENEIDNYRQDHYQMQYTLSMKPEMHFHSSFFYVHGEGYYEQYKEKRDLSAYQLEALDPGVTESDLIQRKWLKNDFYGLNWNFSRETKRYQWMTGGGWNAYAGKHFGKTIWTRQAVRQNAYDHQWYCNTGDKQDASIFTKLHYHLTNSISLLGDLQYRNIRYEIDGIDDDTRILTQQHSYRFWNPKAGISWKTSKYLSLHLYTGMANREPNRTNFKDADPGATPKPEKLLNVEIGADYTKDKRFLSLNLYHMDYRDQLVLTGKINTVGAPVMINVPLSFRQGIECALKLPLLPRLHWTANFSLSRNMIRDFTEYIDNWDEGGQISRPLGKSKLSFSPDIVANNQLTFNILRSIKLDINTKYVGKQYIDNTASEDRKLDPYLVTDLQLVFRPEQKLLRTLELSLQVFNIMNAEYESNAWIYRYYYEGRYQLMDGYFPQAGRHFLAGLKVRI